MEDENMIVGFIIALLCLPEAVGVGMSISPSNNIILGNPLSPSQATTTFSCGNMAANENDINSITYLRIQRMTKREERQAYVTEPVTIAIVQEGNGVQVPVKATDIQISSRVPEGGVQGSITKPDYRNSYLTIAFNTVGLQCDDTGQYICELNYLDKSLRLQKEIDSTNFTASALPTSDGFTLAARKNGISRNSSERLPIRMREEDEIELTCSGFNGGNPNTQLEWLKSDNSGSFVKFIPQSHANAVETREDIEPKPDQCTNFRTTKLKYRITSYDRISNNGRLQFQCFVEVTEQGITTRVESAIFYIEIEAVQSTLKSETSTNDNKVAVVAGALSAVIVVLVVSLVIVIIMWRKPQCMKREPKETAYEIPNRSNQSLEERQYSSLHYEGGYENSTLQN